MRYANSFKSSSLWSDIKIEVSEHTIGHSKLGRMTSHYMYVCLRAMILREYKDLVIWQGFKLQYC